MNANTRQAFQLTAIAAALLAAFGAAHAADAEEIARLTRPESTIDFGLGYADSDGRRFGQYSGVNEQGAYGLLNLDLVRRDDATGTWLKFTGRNLGLDSRSLRFEHSRQGNWGYFIEFNQIPRFEPYIVNTAITGIGGLALTVPAASTSGVNVDLKTKRDVLGLGFDKILWGGFDLQVRFRNEEKDGSRVFARGTTTGSTFEFMPEPINSTTRQLEVTLGYTGERLQFSGGYYGTHYSNQYNGIFITGGSANLAGPCPANCPFTPVALPPDNQSHQLHLTGGYSFTPTTRGTFKLAYAKATQDDNFLTAAQLAPTPVVAGVPANLGGRVDTTLAQVGLSAQPLPKLSVRANLRYEDRDDRTPIFRFNNSAIATSTFNGDNEPRSIRTTAGKLEASYALPEGFRVTGGLDYDEKKRNVSPVRIVSHRDRTEETSYRVELRRSMSETVTGAVSYVHSDRDGSPFLTTTLFGGGAGSNVIAPIYLADRKRDQVRLTLDWTPLEPLSLQFKVHEARDNYNGNRDGSGLGPRKGEARNYALDANYAFSDKWQGTAWISRDDNRVGQSTQTSAGQRWAAELRSLGDAFGIGVRGKPNGQLEIGADLSHSDINDEYRQQAITGAAIASLPDVATKLTRLNVFGKYAVQKNAGVRLNYIYDRFSTDDWTWTTWRYADGTRLLQSPVQKVHFIGISVYHHWK
jgi:MtrB/PioB family decaheme-associated outer membrane protein